MGNKQYRIVLVDDEPGIRKILRLFLETEGFRVYEAVTADQAFAVIRKEKPDIAIVDVFLHGRNGFELCEQVKNDPETKNTFVFIFTAYSQDRYYQEGKRAGCDLYLVKPQNPRDIIEKVKEHLVKKHAVPGRLHYKNFPYPTKHFRKD